MRLLSLGALGLVFALAPCHGAGAQEWPARPVTLIVPFPAGGAIDILGRAVANALSENLGKQFIVDNRTGAGGNIGGAAVAKAPADGYTLMLATISSHGINPALFERMPYDALKDFAPIVLLASSPNVLIVTPSMPVKSVAELVGYAKTKQGDLTFASGGIVSTTMKSFIGFASDSATWPSTSTTGRTLITSVMPRRLRRLTIAVS